MSLDFFNSVSSTGSSRWYQRPKGRVSKPRMDKHNYYSEKVLMGSFKAVGISCDPDGNKINFNKLPTFLTSQSGNVYRERRGGFQDEYFRGYDVTLYPVELQTDMFKGGTMVHGLKPSVRMIKMYDPMDCVYDAEHKYWVVADRSAGIVLVNSDCSQILSTFENTMGATAVALLNNGDHIAFVNSSGISILNVQHGTSELVFGCNTLRGLSVNENGDLITINHQKSRILFIPQDGGIFQYIQYEPATSHNDEGVRSSLTTLAYSKHRLAVVDYTIGHVCVYHLSPDCRSLRDKTVVINCTERATECRLTGIFMDVGGRIFVTNCKEQKLLHYDKDGRFLMSIDLNCRSQGLFITPRFRIMITDSTKTHPAVRCTKLVFRGEKHDSSKFYLPSPGQEAVVPSMDSPTDSMVIKNVKAEPIDEFMESSNYPLTPPEEYYNSHAAAECFAPPKDEPEPGEIDSSMDSSAYVDLNNVKMEEDYEDMETPEYPFTKPQEYADSEVSGQFSSPENEQEEPGEIGYSTNDVDLSKVKVEENPDLFEEESMLHAQSPREFSFAPPWQPRWPVDVYYSNDVTEYQSAPEDDEEI